MPADETYDVVHPLTKKVGKNPPCHNNRNPFQPGYYAEDRYYQNDGRWSRIMTWIPHKMTTECQQPGKQKPDAGCVDCQYLNGGLAT